MKRLLLVFLAICTFCAFTVTGAFGYALEGSKWEPGGDSASLFTTPPGTPGGATWSIMASGHLAPIGDTAHPANAVSQDFFSLMPSALDGSIDTSHFPTGVITSQYAGLWGLSVGAAVPFEALAVDWALDQWAAVSGFSNLGPVADGDGGVANNGTAPSYADWNGNGAFDSAGGNIGDIRIAAYNFLDATLAHAYQPGDASSPGFGIYDNEGGDAHFASSVAEIAGFHWINDPNSSIYPLSGYDYIPNGYDFLTDTLHEMGHALGMAHPASATAGDVMNMYVDRGTALRNLTADDIAGIDAIYGPGGAPSATPEPATILLYGLGFAGAGLYRRMRRRNKT